MITFGQVMMTDLLSTEPSVSGYSEISSDSLFRISEVLNKYK